MRSGKHLVGARAGVGLAAFLILISLAPARVRAQGPQREASGDVRADRQRRRDAAAELRRLGAEIDWRLASSGELNDWVMRAGRARRLAERFGVSVDWRSYGIPELADFEGRLTRAANLRRYGVSVDWRLYTSAQMDELQALVEKQHASGALQPVGPPVATDAGLRFDPDDVLLPTTVAEELARDNDDDDDVMPPSIVGRPNRPEDRPLPPSRGTR
jgi:hypothetical protein